MKKLFVIYSFCEPREKTLIIRETTGLADMGSQVIRAVGFSRCRNIEISRDKRESGVGIKDWGEISHDIFATVDGITKVCVGMCNFYESR